MQLFDTHAHLDDEQLAPMLEQILANAREAGLIGITAIGTTVESSRACVEIAEQSDLVWAAVGIHPNHCAEANESDWTKIRELVDHPKVVAIGETGLDRYWDYCPFEVQASWFNRHIELSLEVCKPFIVHMRDCEDDILNSIRPFAKSQQVKGILHSFTGSPRTAQQCLEWGMHVSFAGMVTFKKAQDIRDVAKIVSDERLLIETDSPYLSPHPKRGQRPNQPALIRHTAECIAEVRGVSLEQLANTTTKNAKQIFKLNMV